MIPFGSDALYQGGEKSGTPGRGAANKVPFLIAVATRDGKPVYTHLRCVDGVTHVVIKDYAHQVIAPGARVATDGFACFRAFAAAGFGHCVRITDGGRPSGVSGEAFKWVNTGLGNVKSAFTGTLRSCDGHHFPRYLAAFAWRFNRRFDLAGNIVRLMRAALAMQPTPHNQIAAV